uniref:Cytosolic juvenile hormone binding protein 36 kDa subunit n=1 Tax=Cherax quadricarinatus TaxID=27406 RepID=G0ZJB7_CHEQU|nr:cytosolic juvenile hormone binding protein 36 kDa subunit [Cherax quadricarinatus]
MMINLYPPGASNKLCPPSSFTGQPFALPFSSGSSESFVAVSLSFIGATSSSFPSASCALALAAFLPFLTGTASFGSGAFLRPLLRVVGMLCVWRLA